MPRPPRREPSFLSFLLYLRSSPSHPFPRRALTFHRLNPRRLRREPPALRRLKHAVDKKQVCRVRQGARARGGKEVEGATTGEQELNDKKGKRKLSRAGVISILLPSSSRLYSSSPPSSVRFHSRQLGIFRLTLDIVFAASRVSFSLEILSTRAATRRLILPQCPFPSLRDRDVTKLTAGTGSRIQLVSYVPF